MKASRSIIVAGALLLGAVVLMACSSEATPTPDESGVPVVVDDPAVIVEGRLQPLNSVELGFKNGGEVAWILVEEGDQVDAGQVLLRLAGGEQLYAAASAAEFEVISAQQALDEIFDTAALVAAQAQLDLASTQGVLEDAERKWQNQQEGYRASSVTIKAAEAELAVAEDAMERAKGEYGGYSGLSRSDPARAQAYKNYAAAYQRYQQALANVNWYTGHPTEIQQAMLDAEVELASAQATEAERVWKAWSEGPDATSLALAEARLANALAQRDAAEAALAELEILAPFSGTVATISVKAGELAAPGQVGVVLADFSGWKIETENLTEIDLPQISLDQSVEINLDALSEVTLAGVVSAISPAFEVRSGDITYAVDIEMLETDPTMEWGMTAIITFGERPVASAMSDSP